jgi:hypothetical protein
LRYCAGRDERMGLCRGPNKRIRPPIEAVRKGLDNFALI